MNNQETKNDQQLKICIVDRIEESDSEKTETDDEKPSTSPKLITCSKCFEKGHNKRTCKSSSVKSVKDTKDVKDVKDTKDTDAEISKEIKRLIKKVGMKKFIKLTQECDYNEFSDDEE